MNEMLDTEYTALVKRKEEIDAALASLPQGYISRKTINGIPLFAEPCQRENGQRLSERR